MAYPRTSILASAALFLSLAACQSTPYWSGDGPEVSGVNPAFENGNLGGMVVLDRYQEISAFEEPSEEQIAELEALRDNFVVAIDGDFSDCSEGDATPLVVFGSRTAELLERTVQRLLVFTPPGPVAGGLVDVGISCGTGRTVVEDAYDYVLGNIIRETDEDENGDESLVTTPGDHRMERLFDDEFASFAVYYQAEPFINWPDPVGYGFFFAGPGRRASSYYGGYPGLVYAGESWDSLDHGRVPPQIPEIAYDAPEQGDRIRGGDEVRYFRQRRTSELTEPLTQYATKRPITNPFATDQDQPDLHTSQSSNNVGVWLGVPHTTEDGSSATRYLRLAQWTGQWCGEESVREGCGGEDDALLNDTRLPVDFRWKWLEPDTPSREDLSLYPGVSPEHVAYLDCVDGGSSEDQCEQDSGIGLPTGDYEDAFLCKSFDEVEDFPWLSDGFCVILEAFDTLRLEQGAQYVDVGPLAVGRWKIDTENDYYDGFGSIGENVMPRGEPVFVSYGEDQSDDGEDPYYGDFYGGVWVPGKNSLMTVPETLPAPGSTGYDRTPYLEVPNVQIETFLAANSPFNDVDEDGNRVDPDTFDGRVYLGYPALLPHPGGFDWRFSLPGGSTSSTEVRSDDMTGDGNWPDTYFVVTLEVRDMSLSSGLGNTTVWRTTAWAWAGDDFITIPAETLSTLPAIGDVFRPDAEDQEGGDLIGVLNIEVHRIASWALANPSSPEGLQEFSNSPAARMVFDVSTMTMGYFYNQHSCFDGIDNDDDGLCDLGDCFDEDGNRLPADPACIPLSDGDGQPEYETAVCQDGEDNDNDGLVDMDDPDCSDPNDPLEDPACSDGIDNDGDGWSDFPEDPGCSELTASDEGGYSYLSDCNDGIDDDGDGRIDADDAGCEDGADTDESGDTCQDGIDNNADGWTDASDLTCRPNSGFEGEVEYSLSDLNVGSVFYECSDFDLLGPTDNDNDGAANADDRDCLSGWDSSGESETPQACSDGIDNDGDGWADGDDPQCLLDPSTESEGPPGGNCSNGQDDDGDGWQDQLDPDCLSGQDDELLATTPLQCNNGIDDDGDGDIDVQDSHCATGKDNHEEQ